MKKAVTGQMTIADLLGDSADAGFLSSEDLDRAIKKLKQERSRVEQRERKERKEREAAEAERRRIEAQREHDEHVAAVTSMELPVTWENAFFGDTRATQVHADSIPDGLILSLNNLGRVDIEYIAAISGSDCKTVITMLIGSIYQNPATWGECFYKGWETSDEYLSGHLISKLKLARKANAEYDGYFERNVKALEVAMPEPPVADEIYITLGSPWVPTHVIDDFIMHLFGYSGDTVAVQGKRRWVPIEDDPHTFNLAYATRHDPLTGTWEIREKNRYRGSVLTTETYGTRRIGALHILERTLNMRPVTVTDEESCPQNASGKKRVINQEETELAIEKQRKLVEAFKEWVWSDPQRADELQVIFEERYCCIRQRSFDGSFLTLPTMAPSQHLRPYQKDAVARMIFSPNTLLAHEVGSGKTYEMIAAGMELLRMGLSSKNLYVVPNNIVGQWHEVFHVLYPDANVLYVEPNGFRPARRELVLADIRDGAYDAIVMAYSCFERIPISRAYYQGELERKQEAIASILSTPSKATSKLAKRQRQIEKALAELNEAIESTYDGVYFDELGITRLFVDEAHNFKNIPFEASMGKVLGINPKGSKRCQDMLDKIRVVQKANGGGGVVLATGTPISNSISAPMRCKRTCSLGS